MTTNCTTILVGHPIQKVLILLTLFAFSTFCTTILATPVQFQHADKGGPSPIAAIPNHRSAKGENYSNAPEPVTLFTNSEPAPMGIADYGLGSAGAYNYNSSAFLGIAQISSLTTSAPQSSGGPNMTFQLNVVLPFSSQNGRQFVYWLQNVIIYDTSNHEAYFENNVWNMSSPTAQMASSGISGSGQVYNYNSSGYYAEVTSSYVYIPFQATIQFLINSTIDSQSEPKIYFQYNYGTGWQTYDAVTFPVMTSQSLDSGFVVDGTKYNPYGTYYDAELIMGGAGNGWNTTLVRSNVKLQLQFWNDHNYQAVTNAYTFGSNTLEGINNAQSVGQYYQGNGTVFAQVSPGSETLGSLYSQSQISVVTIQSSINSGIVYVRSSSSSIPSNGNSFTGQGATLTLFPGTYTFYIYSASGTQFGRLTAPITAGEVHTYFISPSSTVTLTLSYSITGGGTGYSPPILSYLSNGIENTSTLKTSPTVYYVDHGSTWSITTTLNGSTSQERWITNQTTSGSASSPETLNLLFYHQYLISFNYSVFGGGTGYSAPSVTATQFGSNVSTSVRQSVWLDAGSHYSYSNLLNGSTQTERWKANDFTSGQVQATITNMPTYYHQFAIIARLSVSNGGTPSVGPTLTSRSFGRANSSVLTDTPALIWVDAGSAYSFSNNVTTSPQERWITNSSNSGIATSSLTLDAVFTHQYYLTLQANAQSAGTVNPQSKWVNAGSTLTISSSASPGWKFEMWNGTGKGAYTGDVSTTTITAQGPIVENSIFYTGLTIIPKGSGSVFYSFGSTSSTVTTTKTIYVPVGTNVTLNAVPTSFFDKLNSWSGAVSGINTQTSLAIQSPAIVQAQFGLNFIIVGAIIGAIAVLAAVIVGLSKRRKDQTPT